MVIESRTRVICRKWQIIKGDTEGFPVQYVD